MCVCVCVCVHATYVHVLVFYVCALTSCRFALAFLSLSLSASDLAAFSNSENLVCNSRFDKGKVLPIKAHQEHQPSN